MTKLDSIGGPAGIVPVRKPYLGMSCFVAMPPRSHERVTVLCGVNLIVYSLSEHAL